VQQHLDHIKIIRDFADAEEERARRQGLESYVETHHIVDKIASSIVMFKMKGPTAMNTSRNMKAFNASTLLK
jgi:hypothetical protein